MPRRTDTGRAQHGALRPILIIGPRQGSRRRIALVAHDNKKRDLLDWARFNRDGLAQHQLFATGTTGGMIQSELGLEVTRFNSGPLGGDQQLGAKITEGGIDLVLSFWDPLKPQPHDPDERALLRIAVVWNIPIACNRATADYLISSPLLDSDYHPLQPDYGTVQPPWLVRFTAPPRAAPRRDSQPYGPMRLVLPLRRCRGPVGVSPAPAAREAIRFPKVSLGRYDRPGGCGVAGLDQDQGLGCCPVQPGTRDLDHRAGIHHLRQTYWPADQLTSRCRPLGSRPSSKVEYRPGMLRTTRRHSATDSGQVKPHDAHGSPNCRRCHSLTRRELCRILDLLHETVLYCRIPVSLRRVPPSPRPSGIDLGPWPRRRSGGPVDSAPSRLPDRTKVPDGSGH